MIKLFFFITAIAVIMFGVIAGVGALLHYIDNHRGIVKMITGEDDDDDDEVVG